MDADKEGFLRSERSLTQTAGRAARNAQGRVIMYADKITDSMRRTIDETARRRAVQETYNRDHGITPTQIVKSRKGIFGTETIQGGGKRADYTLTSEQRIAAEPAATYFTGNIDEAIDRARAAMEEAAKKLDFVNAARFRDEMYELQSQQSRHKQ
jgi:excinuclease ABC subunit B